MFMGFPGLGFTFNFGGNAAGGPRASFNFMSFGICIAMVVLSMAGEFFSVLTPRVDLYEAGAARRYGQRHSQQTADPQRARRPRPQPAAPEQSDLASYIFSGLYTLCVVAFIAYAISQRNRNARPL
jgi:hypothetical protein